MKAYVCAAFMDYERARKAMGTLSRRGFTITHDWTVDAERGPQDDVSPELKRLWASQDINGVKAADVVLVLAPNTLAARGMWVEMGAALAWGKVVFISGPQRLYNVFTSLCDDGCDTDERLVELACAYRTRMQEAAE